MACRYWARGLSHPFSPQPPSPQAWTQPSLFWLHSWGSLLGLPAGIHPQFYLHLATVVTTPQPSPWVHCTSTLTYTGSPISQRAIRLGRLLQSIGEKVYDPVFGLQKDLSPHCSGPFWGCRDYSRAISVFSAPQNKAAGEGSVLVRHWF